MKSFGLILSEKILRKSNIHSVVGLLCKSTIKKRVKEDKKKYKIYCLRSKRTPENLMLDLLVLKGIRKIKNTGNAALRERILPANPAAYGSGGKAQGIPST